MAPSISATTRATWKPGAGNGVGTIDVVNAAIASPAYGKATATASAARDPAVDRAFTLRARPTTMTATTTVAGTRARYSDGNVRRVDRSVRCAAVRRASAVGPLAVTMTYPRSVFDAVRSRR